MRLTAVLLALLVVPPAFARSLRTQLGQSAQTVGLSGGAAFDALADAIADTAARSLPILSASAGFTYRYNPELEVFERTSDTLGPLFLERPDTIGRGKMNFNVSYQYVQFDEFDGNTIKPLQAPDPIVIRVVDSSGNPIGLTANRLRYSLKIQNYITSLSFTYGVLPNLDVNILMPLIVTNFGVSVRSQQLFAAEPGSPFVPAPLAEQQGHTDGNAFGVGDILLRGKYRLPDYGWLRSAAGLQLRLPAGKEEDFQGTGTFEASPFIYLSTVLWGRLEPHANAGLDLRADDVSRSEARYGLGADLDVTKRIGLALAFLGRSQFSGTASPSDTAFQHLIGGTTVALRPLLGVDFGRKDSFDLSFGARAVVWRQLMFFVNGIYALNDEGLRNDTVIPTVGFEGTF